MNLHDWACTSNRMVYNFAILTGIIIVAASFAIFASSSPHHKTARPNPSRSNKQPFPIEISPDPFEIGRISPGQSARATFVFRNAGSQVMTIRRIETSCPCLVVDPTAVEVGSGESTILSARFDGSEDPGFRGRLSINVKGFDAMEKLVFSTSVNLEVKPRPVKASEHLSGP